MQRLRRWSPATTLPAVGAIAVCGTAALAGFGYSTGFLGGPRWPSSWEDALSKLAMTFVAPALIEESLFRGLLIRLPGESEPVSQPEALIAPAVVAAEGREDGATATAAEQTTGALAEWRRVVDRGELPEQLACWGLFVFFHLDVIHTWSMFRDARFLSEAAILGLACQAACVATRSLWPGVLMHWLWVWSWFVIA